MSNGPAAWILIAAASAGGAQVPVAAEHAKYVVSVSFFDRHCQFQTGDVFFDSAGFRDDLRKRFDAAQGLIVYHAAETPKKCIVKAMTVARQVGFRDVKDEIGQPNMGPP